MNAEVEESHLVTSMDSLSRYREALAGLRLEESIAEASEVGRILCDTEQSGLLPSFPANFPTIKQIPGTRFVVDGFRSAGNYSVSYFLSHFHSDHYTGITHLWNKGLIYCSEITASLVVKVLNVADVFVVALPMGEVVRIDGVEVVLVDANHCPGAVQFLFRVPQEGTQGDLLEHHRYVHCGDMRYSASMKEDASLANFVGADVVFLDTTYCNPKFIFPSQKESVVYVADTVFKLMQGVDVDDTECVVEEVDVVPAGLRRVGEGEGSEIEAITEVHRTTDSSVDSERLGEAGLDDEDIYQVARQVKMASTNKSILFLISTYVIGKEKILIAVAKQCRCLLYVNERKLSILKCLDLEDIGIFTTDPTATNVHIVGWSFLGETWPYFRPNFGNMEKIMTESGFSRVVGFVPTGWTYELKKKIFSVRRKGSCEIHLVPYSEHSNYEELREYVGFLRPKEIIPTVGLEGGGVDGKAVAAMRKHFRNLVDETASKKKFLKCFTRKLGDENDPLFSKQNHIQEALGRPKVDIAAGKSNNDMKDKPFPKAVFRRDARKRHRDTDTSSTDIGEDQHNVSSPIGSQILLEYKGTDRNDKIIVPVESMGTELFFSRSFEKLSEVELENKMAPNADAGQKIEEQLRSILPDWVSQEQANRLLRQANGDVTAAVAEFYEKEMDLMDEIFSGQKSVEGEELEEPKGQVMNVKHDIGEIGIKQNTLTVEVSKVGLAGAISSQASPPAKKHVSKIASKGPTTNTRSRPGSTSKAAKNRKGKVKALLPSSSPGKLKASQPTILTFFKKLGSEVAPTATGLVNSASDGTEAMDAAYSPCLIGDDMDVEVEELNGTIASTEHQTVEQNASSQLTTKQVEDNNLETNSDIEALRHPDGFSQLLLILDGSVTNDEAQQLLKEVNWDVSKALDLHYSRKLGSKGSKSSPCKSVSIGGVIAATSNYQETGTSSVAKESEFSFASKELFTGDLEVSKPDPPSSSGDHLGSPCGESTMAPEVSRSILVSDINLGSIATSVGKYNPVDHACWKVGEAAPYVHLARAFDLVEHESGRLKTTDMLCNMFRSLLALSPEDIHPAVYLATNRIAPDFENSDLNIGGSTVAAAISEATGTPRAKLRDMYNNMGDLGDVAQACRQNQSMLRPPPALRIRQVFSTLHQISKESGSGSGARKKSLVLGLIRACREMETKYIVRTLVQNMRIGAMMRTVLPALAQAVVFHRCLPFDRPTEKAHESLKTKLQEASAAAVEAYNFLPNLDLLIPILIKEGAEGLTTSISVRAGTPIKPMLAKITNGIPEVLKRFQGKAFTCEYKYDGQRAQIHLLPDGSVRIFSRNCEDNTSKFPDVVDIVRSAMQPGTNLFIIDAEVVAVDRENGNNLMAFQHLSTRERGAKDGSIIQNIKVEVCVFLFDIMLVNDKSLVKCPLRERRKYMHAIFPDLKPGYIQYASELTVESEDAQADSMSTSQSLDNFLDEAFGASCEGLMVKALDEDATYMASKRSDSWLKVKRDYVEGLHDTLDLVPIGAWHGNGRKAGWYSPFLVACYDSNSEEYQSVCRVMSGFSDSFYRETKDFYSGERILPKKPVYYQTREECDVWFSAEVVWEIRGADLTISPVHQAGVGLVHPSRGMSMRFPRFISVRTDKKPEDASSPSEIAELFHRQTRKLDVPGMGTKEKADSD